MPMLEVIYERDEPLDPERKRAFARAAVAAFGAVIGTPPGRLRLAFRHVAPEDGLGLLREAEAEDDDGEGASRKNTG